MANIQGVPLRMKKVSALLCILFYGRYVILYTLLIDSFINKNKTSILHGFDQGTPENNPWF